MARILVPKLQLGNEGTKPGWRGAFSEDQERNHDQE
jgi:hypothetical protein